MRQPSEKTQLLRLRREANRFSIERAGLQSQIAGYRTRATKAEQEAAEWKARFDQLLKVTTQRPAGEVGERR